jgi:2-polyprenyl-3-methyl-5-hydroxy-6-metoxy-1,4-benzoquinol methylase
VSPHESSGCETHREQLIAGKSEFLSRHRFWALLEGRAQGGLEIRLESACDPSFATVAGPESRYNVQHLDQPMRHVLERFKGQEQGRSEVLLDRMQAKSVLRTGLRGFVKANVALSEALEHCLPERLRRDGNQDFRETIVPSVLFPGAIVYDLGGGSRPGITLQEKQRLQLTVYAVDLSMEELEAAPAGIYDRKTAADLCLFTGTGDADVVICQATLEHVHDAAGAFRAMTSCIKPGGLIAIFAPSRNALFARLNRLLPEELKRRILFAIFPQTGEGHDGFPAFYDRCVPREIEFLAAEHRLKVVERRLYWRSAYFFFFSPAYLLWRLWLGGTYVFLGPNAAETFAYVFQKEGGSAADCSAGRNAPCKRA